MDDDALTVAVTNEPAALVAPDKEEDWLSDQKKDIPPTAPAAKAAAADDSNAKPMILVDFSVLSAGAVHNKHDKNGVNDIDLKKKFTEQVTREMKDEAKLAEMVAAGVCYACGPSVWREALVTLRDQHPGHYFGPIF
jgi:hypothetical protein